MEDNYPVDSEKIYFSEDYLTLEMEGVPTTLRIGEWLNTDPVRIHRMIVRDKVLRPGSLTTRTLSVSTNGGGKASMSTSSPCLRPTSSSFSRRSGRWIRR